MAVERALQPKQRGYVDAEGQFQLAEGEWRPTVLDDAAKAEARRMLEALSLDQADEQTTAKWLTALGTMTATGKMTVDDAKAKLLAFAKMLRYPAGCFSRDSLDRAGRRFSWFPSYAEVAEFLDGERDRLATRRRRLEALLDTEAKPTAEQSKPRRWADLSSEQKAATDALLARLRAKCMGEPAAE